MNKDKHMNKAKEFTKERNAYIHCEVKNGETQLAVSGDTRAIVYGCYRTLKRTGELTGLPFAIAIQSLEDLYHMETGEQIKEV